MFCSEASSSPQNRRTMPKATHTTTKRAHHSRNIDFAQKHAWFEEAASRFDVKHQSEEKNSHGVELHVVLTEAGGIPRWPTWYEQGA